jgi:hypothetical protein
MRRFRTSHLLLPMLACLLAACGVVGGSPAPTATPTQAQNLGLEVAETYGQLMEQMRTLVEPRPPAPEIKEELRLLGEEYKVRFGNYACLRDTLSDADQAEVASTFDTNREAFLPEDMSWFEDAASDYDFEDTAIRERMEEMATLDDYAFLERADQSRPGEEILCGG